MRIKTAPFLKAMPPPPHRPETPTGTAASGRLSEGQSFYWYPRPQALPPPQNRLYVRTSKNTKFHARPRSFIP